MFLKQHNVSVEEKEKETNIVCNTCEYINSIDSRYCHSCYRPLTVKFLLNDQERINQQIQLRTEKMFEMFSDPEFVKKFEKFSNSSIN